MPTIDLSSAPTVPSGTLEALPRRVTLTLPELLLLAEKAGGAPLPFDPPVRDGADPADSSALQSRLGRTPHNPVGGPADDEAYLAALASLNDPVESLTRRGLVVDGVADNGVAGALGLLAVPEIAVDLDVAVDQIRGRGWHRQRGDAGATLPTTDGLSFELAWFDSSHWPGELARVATLPEDVVLEPSAAPELAVLPYELLDTGAEAVRTGRSDLLGALVAETPGVVDEAATTELLGALVAETHGRLRAMVADITADGVVVGVVSWVLLADGWRELRAHQADGARLVEVRRVQPADLSLTLGPVLAEVTS
jgi:hypothetical protein